MRSIALLLQNLAEDQQVLVLSRLAEARQEGGRFAPAVLDDLFDEIALPRPSKVSNNLSRLEREGLVARQKNAKGSWRLTPKGRALSVDLIDDMGLAALQAEMSPDRAPAFGHVAHPVVPPWLAPPELLAGLQEFLEEYPFDSNVFGMTRFPDEQDDAYPDPVSAAIEEATEACAMHGFTFHLADRHNIVDDLWANVAAHMWACRYGIAFFEDRRGRGVNYNLTIEVGGMLTTGRRVALLKDQSIGALPTDLVGKIYTSVDLEKTGEVSRAVHTWLRDHLRVGSCSACP